MSSAKWLPSCFDHNVFICPQLDSDCPSPVTGTTESTWVLFTLSHNATHITKCICSILSKWTQRLFFNEKQQLKDKISLFFWNDYAWNCVECWECTSFASGMHSVAQTCFKVAMKGCMPSSDLRTRPYVGLNKILMFLWISLPFFFFQLKEKYCKLIYSETSTTRSRRLSRDSTAAPCCCSGGCGNNTTRHLTHGCLVTYMCVSEFGHHWFW